MKQGKILKTKALLIVCGLAVLSGYFSNVICELKITDNLTLDAEFRPRYEFDNRDFNSETGYDYYGTMRSRLGFRLQNIIEQTQLYMMIGDSRMLGYSNPYLTGKEPPGPNGYDNNLGIIKVYIEMRDLISSGSMLRIGRMSNDQGRFIIFGAGDWNLYGPRTYDGFKLGIEREEYSWHLWSFFGANGDRHWYPVAGNPSKTPDNTKDYKRDHTLTGVDYTIWMKRINFLLFMDIDQLPVLNVLKNENNIALFRNTAAVNLNWKSPGTGSERIDFDAAYQFGTMAHDSGNADISAWMIAGDWAHYFESQTKSWLGLGFQFVSGDDKSDPDDDVTWFFDDYSSKHSYFGRMDYFKSQTGEKSLGLHDIFLKGGMNLTNKLAGRLYLHNFTVQESFISQKDNSDANSLGQELDTQLIYNIRKGLTAELGVDFFVPSEDWKGSSPDHATFIYLVLTARI